MPTSPRSKPATSAPYAQREQRARPGGTPAIVARATACAVVGRVDQDIETVASVAASSDTAVACRAGGVVVARNPAHRVVARCEEPGADEGEYDTEDAETRRSAWIEGQRRAAGHDQRRADQHHRT